MSTVVAVATDTKTLVGFTANKKYRVYGVGENEQYPGAILVEEVRERLFYWEAEARHSAAVEFDDEGNLADIYLDPTRVQIFRPDTRIVMGVHGWDSYRMHQYPVWLLDNIAPILGGNLGLGIGLAVELKGGAIAAVSIEVPESIVTPEGVAFRPHLLATTSHDASLSTTYNRGVTVFGHPMAAGIAKRVQGQQSFKIRHTKNSVSRLKDAQDAAAVVEEIIADFEEEITELVLTPVSEKEFERFLSAMYPIPEEEGRSATMKTNRQASVRRMLREDERVARWSRTAWGVLLAVNIANHEEGIVRGDRDERNLMKLVGGQYIAEDQKALRTLQSVLDD